MDSDNELIKFNIESFFTEIFGLVAETAPIRGYWPFAWMENA